MSFTMPGSHISKPCVFLRMIRSGPHPAFPRGVELAADPLICAPNVLRLWEQLSPTELHYFFTCLAES